MVVQVLFLFILVLSSLPNKISSWYLQISTTKPAYQTWSKLSQPPLMQHNKQGSIVSADTGPTELATMLHPTKRTLGKYPCIDMDYKILRSECQKYFLYKR